MKTKNCKKQNEFEGGGAFEHSKVKIKNTDTKIIN